MGHPHITQSGSKSFLLAMSDGVLTGDADVRGHGVHKLRHLPLLAGLAARVPYCHTGGGTNRVDSLHSMKAYTRRRDDVSL